MFVKNGRFCVIYSFSNQNCNIISAYFLYFCRFASPIYNSMSTHYIDLPHNTTVRVGWYWTIFVKKDHFLVILSFSNQNWNRISIYIFLSFPSQIYYRIPIYFIDFLHMTMRSLWFWHCVWQKDHIFWNFIVVPPKLQ